MYKTLMGIIGTFLLLGFPLFSFAFSFSPPTGYILDQANIFSEEEQQQLTLQITDIQTKTTAEIAIFTIPSLDGEDIFSVGMQVAESWKIGKKDVDNGLLLLISVEDRQWQFFTGYGLEGTLPDALMVRIGERFFPTSFRAEAYAHGVSLALTDILALLQSDPSVVSSYSEPPLSAWMMSIPMMGMGLIVGILSLGFFGGRKLPASFGSAGMLQYIGVSMALDAGIPFWHGILLALPAVVFALVIVRYMKRGKSSFWDVSGGSGWGSSSGSSGSSGFSGFGGGSFGGGGGGGRW